MESEKLIQPRYHLPLLLVVLFVVSVALNIYFLWFAYTYKTAESYDIGTDRFFFGTSGKRICAQLQKANWFDSRPRAKSACELIINEF